MVDVPLEKENRSEEQQAKYLLANMLDWYRREQKSLWWEYYRLKELSDEDLLEEKTAISMLEYTGKRASVQEKCRGLSIIILSRNLKWKKEIR